MGDPMFSPGVLVQVHREALKHRKSPIGWLRLNRDEVVLVVGVDRKFLSNLRYVLLSSQGIKLMDMETAERILEPVT